MPCVGILGARPPVRASAVAANQVQEFNSPKSLLGRDLLVAGIVIVELKAVEKILAVHEAQVLTYMKLSGRQRGLLLKFNVKLLKHGIRRSNLTE